MDTKCLRRCDILLYKGSGLTSRLIQWGTKSPYSHVAVVVEPQKEKDYFCSELCYEAFAAAGLDIVPQVTQADITSPGDIARSERLMNITI